MTIDLASIGARTSEIGVLNAAGDQGWELVQILPPYKAILRRQVGENLPEKASDPAATGVAPKYRNPATGETWSGRGRMASWLAAKVQAGESVDRYLVSPSD